LGSQRGARWGYMYFVVCFFLFFFLFFFSRLRRGKPDFVEDLPLAAR
jgi:hypothetical protein